MSKLAGYLVGASIALASPAFAAPMLKPMTAAEVRDELLPGQQVEARLDGDFNSDGEIDTALVIAGPDDERVVRVFLSLREEVSIDRLPAGSFELLPAPLGTAGLSVEKGVLVIRDLTGGTTATSVTYRLRGERTEPKMRLIGLDATSYSRTFAHDGSKLSWNLLTGDMIVSRLKVAAGDEANGYQTVDTKRSRRMANSLYGKDAIYMEDVPDAEELLRIVAPGS